MSLDPFHPPPVQGAPEVNAVRGCVSSSPLYFFGYSHQTGMEEPGTLKQIFPSFLSLYGDQGFVCSFSAPSAFLFFDSSCSLSSAPSLLCSHLFLVSLSLLGSILLSSLVPLPPFLGQEPGPPPTPQSPTGSGVVAVIAVMVQGKFAAGTLWGRLMSPASTPVFCKAFLLPSQ